MTTQSETPRTDTFVAERDSPVARKIHDFCRTLEREAAQLRADREALSAELRIAADAIPTIYRNRILEALKQHGGSMNNEGFSGERDLVITRQTAAIIVASVIGLFVLASIL